MTITSAPIPQSRLPGVGFEAVRASKTDSLRTDIALFIGRTERGPLDAQFDEPVDLPLAVRDTARLPASVPVRIDGMRAFHEVFGNFLGNSHCALAVRGFFDNGGRLTWVLRLEGGQVTARQTWPVAAAGAFVPPGIGLDRLRFAASSPGAWGNALTIVPEMRRTVSGLTLDLEVRQSGRVAERLSGLPVDSPEALAEALARRSLLVRLEADPAALPIASPGSGPTRQTWPTISLDSGTDGTGTVQQHYEAALEAAMQLAEPALIALPDLHADLDETTAANVLLAAARQADVLLDRMILADAPEGIRDEQGFAAWLARFQQDPSVHRAVAAYHPWLHVHDPLGDVRAPLRTLPPSGHVAGAIARSDLTRGAYVTPANIALGEVVDTSRRIVPEATLALAEGGLNLLQCQSGRGLVVWGGRMLRTDAAAPRFVAHRRFIQRLVRALRRTWAPMVFEPNDDSLRYAIARQATTLLLEAFRSGILKGARPDEAFRVDVSERLNDAAARADGKVFCEIAIAPAVPMEFIKIQISLSLDGTVELVEP